MGRIIDDMMISKYVTKEYRFGKSSFKSIFGYTGNKVGDTDELIVGFSNGKDTYTASVYLPVVAENGMYQKNYSMWYPISFVVPPLHFNMYKNKIGSVYLNKLLNSEIFALSSDQFMPKTTHSRPAISSMLMRELMTDKPLDINDIYNWNVITLPYAVIELFNYKFIESAGRSMRGGFGGVSGIAKSIHTLINAMTRYFSNNNEEIYYDSYDMDEVELNHMTKDDKKGVLVIHEYIKEINISNMQPIDFCTCSQSMPMRTARIKSGVTIEGTKFKGTPDFPYAEYRKAVPGILHDDPHRVIVSRAISRAMMLDSDSVPYVKTEVPIGIDSINLPGVRMTHPLNLEDGIIVSEYFAKAAGAYKVLVDKFVYPKEYELVFKKTTCPDGEESQCAKIAAGSVKQNLDMLCNHEYDNIFVTPGDVIAEISYKDISGEPVTQQIKTTLKVKATVLNTESYEIASDFESTMITHKITYLAFFPLTIGSKVSDAHANKATVSAIFPDDKMPVWEGIPVHYIATPYIMKRLAVGAEIEDKLALIGKDIRNKDEAYSYEIDSHIRWNINELNNKLRERGLVYRGKVEFDGKTFPAVPVSYRMMFRIDNNPEETMVIKHDVICDDKKRVSRNTKLSLDLVTLAARGANNLMNELIHHSGSRLYMQESVMPIINAIGCHVPKDARTYDINRRVDRELLGAAVSADILLYIVENGMKQERCFENTVVDPRCVDHYGIIRHKDTIFVVPPHEQFLHMSSGLYMIERIAVEANRLLAEIISEDRMGKEYAQVKYIANRYYMKLASIISGKNGMMRDALLPVFGKSIRAVITPYIGNDPLEVMVPRAAFNNMMHRSGDEFREFYSKKHMCLIKRDPVHRNNNLLGVKFRLWDQDTIGIHPALVKVLDGDYDGDTAIVAFADTTLGYNDLYKLIPDFEKVYCGSKQLTDVPYNEVNRALIENIGWASSFGNPHPTDILKNQKLLNNLVTGLDMEHANFECIKAVKDFCVIKDGTASTGALSLRYIFTRRVDNMELLHESMELYHKMAQCTLDAKAGTPTPSLDIVDAFRFNKENAIRRGMENLGYRHEQCINAFVEFADAVYTDGRMDAYLVQQNPILYITQKSVDTEEMLNFIKDFAADCIKGKSFGDGVMEKLFDYILGKTEVTPFDYTVDINELFKMSNIMHKEEAREVSAV